MKTIKVVQSIAIEFSREEAEIIRKACLRGLRNGFWWSESEKSAFEHFTGLLSGAIIQEHWVNNPSESKHRGY